jgi:hypothetical protein
VQVSLAGLKLIVLDEADKLFEANKGFMEQMDAVFTACRACVGLTRCLFSATLPEWVEQVAGSVLQVSTSIIVGAKNSASQNVQQSLLFVGQVRSPPRGPHISYEPYMRNGNYPKGSAPHDKCCTKYITWHLAATLQVSSQNSLSNGWLSLA